MTAPARPERVPGQAPLDLGLDEKDGDGRSRPVGRVERLTAAALADGITRGVLDKGLDQAAAGLAVALARAVDRGAHDPYAVAAAGRELSALLARLRMDPESRDSGDASGFDPDAWLASVTAQG